MQSPQVTQRPLQFENGPALGVSTRVGRRQYCQILTGVGFVGCGVYDLKTTTELDGAIAIAKDTPDAPLVEPEDLFDAEIVGLTPQAEELGITVGMKGREAVEIMLKAASERE